MSLMRNTLLRLFTAFFVTTIAILPFASTSPCYAQSQEEISGDSEYRVVRVGLYENKPKIFTDEAGEPSGIFVGILDEIAEIEKWQLEWIPCEWSQCLSYLEEGRIDLMPDVAFSLERDSALDFNEELVLESWSQVYARDVKTVKSLSDLDGLKLALLEGSIQQVFLHQIMDGFGYNVTFVETSSYEDAFTLASNGTVDVAVSNHFWGDYCYQEYGLVKTAIVFNPASLYFATASGTNSELLDAIDRNLRSMKSQRSSVYYTELENWMERPPKVITPKFMFWILGGIGGFLILAVVIILFLRRQVRIKTEHLVRANATLQKSEEKFRNLFHNHLAVKLMIDPETGIIVDANKEAEEFYGWSEEQLRQMKIQDINTLPTEIVEEQLEKIRTGQRAVFEFQHRLADGSVRDVEVFSSKIDIEGKILLHSIIHDITEQKQAEKEQERLQAQLNQAQKMEFVGRLAGGVAHDYNNMLSVISGYAELALDKLKPSNPLHEDIEEILKAARRSSEITRQLLAFARKQTIRPRLLDINEVVASMLNMVRRLIGEDIDLNWRPDNRLWPVKIDPSQVEQILANLCVNARDAIEGVGKIMIETHTVIFDDAYCADHTGFIPGEFVVLAVSDDGCGMEKEILANIFEPFFTTKDVHKGTGLGWLPSTGLSNRTAVSSTFTANPERGRPSGFICLVMWVKRRGSIWKSLRRFRRVMVSWCLSLRMNRQSGRWGR